MDFIRWLAIIPGIFLIIQVYKQDKIEKEPIGLIIKLLIFGALTVISAMALETLGEDILFSTLGEGGRVSAAIDCFIVVAMSEEAGKYVVMKLCTWKHKAFNYRFDGIVYAVCASMGFAIVENIFYCLDGDISTALLRAVTAVPGHCIFAIFMGHYYGEAKLCEARGDKLRMSVNKKKAFFVPVLIHGFYDYCLSVDSWMATLTFLVFIVVLDLYTIKQIKKFSAEDVAIYQNDVGTWNSDF